MISSLFLYITAVFYRGDYSLRMNWTLLFFTMGVVAVARLAIEQSRNYAIGYTLVLCAAGVTVIGRYAGSPTFAIILVALIAFTADRLVFDCTLIDDSIDASGSGLIDSGRMFVNKQMGNSDQPTKTDPNTSDEPQLKKKKSRRRTHQPGRTIMYFALAALPMFGIGELFSPDEGAAAFARKCLAGYLFSALSLLMTTSFLGLRRYLRQRDVDMPTDVTASWLGGGLALVAGIIGVAFLIPVPGQWIGGLEPPITLANAKDFTASRFGFGKEAAQNSGESPSTTQEDKSPEKEIGGTRTEQGAEAGEASGGKRKDGPAGNEKGKSKQGGGESEQKQQGGEKKDQQSKSASESQKDKSKSDGQKQSPSKEQSSDQPKTESGKKTQSNQQSEEQNSDPKSRQSESTENKSDASDAQQQQRKSEPSEADQSKSDPTQSEQTESQQSEQSESKQSESTDDASSEPESTTRSNSSSFFDKLSGLFGSLGQLIRIAFMLALALVVVWYLAKHGSKLMDWLRDLFGGRQDVAAQQTGGQLATNPQPRTPPKPFSSFHNPFGRETDPQRIIVVTFQAAEAWLRENVSDRTPDETPSEFVVRIRRIVAAKPDRRVDEGLPVAMQSLVNAYNRVAYAGARPSPADLEAAKSVWATLR